MEMMMAIPGMDDKESVAFVKACSFAARMKRENPEHGRLFCDHGTHLGSAPEPGKCPFAGMAPVVDPAFAEQRENARLVLESLS